MRRPHGIYDGECQRARDIPSYRKPAEPGPHWFEEYVPIKKMKGKETAGGVRRGKLAHVLLEEED